jgi:hypothetical protein
VQGPQGVPGLANVIASDIWSWTTNTGSAASSGQVGISSATWAGTTQLNLNEQTKDGRNVVTIAFQRIKTGDLFYLQHKTDPTRFAYLRITGAPTDHGTWWSWPVSVESSGGAVPGGTTDTDVTLIRDTDPVATATVIGTRIEGLDGTFTIPSGAWERAPFTFARYDTETWFDPDTYGADTLGLQGHIGPYDLFGLAMFEANPNGVRGIALAGASGVDPSTIQGVNVAPAGVTVLPFNPQNALSVAASYYAGSTGFFGLHLWVFQNSGVDLHVGTGSIGSLGLAAHYRGPLS